MSSTCQVWGDLFERQDTRRGSFSDSLALALVLCLYFFCCILMSRVYSLCWNEELCLTSFGPFSKKSVYIFLAYKDGFWGGWIFLGSFHKPASSLYFLHRIQFLEKPPIQPDHLYVGKSRQKNKKKHEEYEEANDQIIPCAFLVLGLAILVFTQSCNPADLAL